MEMTHDTWLPFAPDFTDLPDFLAFMEDQSVGIESVEEQAGLTSSMAQSGGGFEGLWISVQAILQSFFGKVLG